MAEDLKDGKAEATPPIEDPTDVSAESVEPEIAPAPPEAPAEPEKKTHQHAAPLAQMALELGISQQELEVTSPEALHALLPHLNRAAQERAFHAGRAQVPQQVQKQQQQGPPAIDWGTGEDGKKYTEADYAPAVARTIKDNHRLSLENAQIKSYLAQQHTQTQAQTQGSIIDQVDHAFDTIAPQFKEIVGKGRGRDMHQDDPAYQARLAIFNAANADYGPGTPAEKITRATEKLYGKVVGKGRVSKEDWLAGGLAKPTQRAGATEPHGRKRAVQAAAKFMRERGMLATDDDDDLL